MVLFGLIFGALLLLGSFFMWKPYLLSAYPLFLSGCVTQSPRNIIIVFTSFKRLKVVELMLTTYTKYKKEDWELYIFTDLRKEAAGERFNDSAAPVGANLVVINKNMYKDQKFWEHEPRAAGVQNIRMIVWRDWFRENNEEFRPSDRIILTDEDIFFNGNPFERFLRLSQALAFFLFGVNGIFEQRWMKRILYQNEHTFPHCAESCFQAAGLLYRGSDGDSVCNPTVFGESGYCLCH